MALIAVTPTISLDERELAFDFVRASGPGGQNVNKVASAVYLRFDLHGSPSLNDGVKHRLGLLAGQRLMSDGVLVIFAQKHRSQDLNRADARARLFALIAEAAEVPKTRYRTRPTLASKRRRLEGKARRSDLKLGRGRASVDDR